VTVKKKPGTTMASDIYHKGCQERVGSCDEGARYPVQWLGGGDTP